jgi:transporter family-2 protein
MHWMSPAPAVLTMIAVGGLFALQAPVNAGLARETGRLPAALVSFLVGTVLLGIVVSAGGGLGDLGRLSQAAPYEFCGGLIGAAFVLTALAAVPIIGAGGVAAATITGQMIGSIALDGDGALGLAPDPITAARVAGALLLLIGTMLILRSTPSAGEFRTGDGRSIGRTAAALLIVAGGALLATQAPINAGLGDAIGELDAAFVNFAVGALVLAIAVVLRRRGAGLAAAPRAPRRYLLGGVIGAICVATAIALVRTIGAGGLAAATISGQLVASVALDRAGAFGLQRRSFTPLRLVAVALLAGGTYLVVV